MSIKLWKCWRCWKCSYQGLFYTKYIKYNTIQCKVCFNKGTVTCFLKQVLLLQFSFHFYPILTNNPLFLAGFKENIQNLGKYISKFLSKDSYRIRIARSQNYLLILSKFRNSSFKEKKTSIFLAHWLNFILF